MGPGRQQLEGRVAGVLLLGHPTPTMLPQVALGILLFSMLGGKRRQPSPEPEEEPESEEGTWQVEFGEAQLEDESPRVEVEIGPAVIESIGEDAPDSSESRERDTLPALDANFHGVRLEES